MTQRFLAGFHANFGQMGIWLSNPGVDVTLAGPAANFLLRSDLKYEQIVWSGSVNVAPGATVTVALPANLLKSPYVALTANISGLVEYPCDLNATAPGGANGNEITFSPHIFGDQIQFFNGNAFTNVVGSYMVFNRSIGV